MLLIRRHKRQLAIQKLAFVARQPRTKTSSSDHCSVTAARIGSFPKCKECDRDRKTSSTKDVRCATANKSLLPRKHKPLSHQVIIGDPNALHLQKLSAQADTTAKSASLPSTQCDSFPAALCPHTIPTCRQIRNEKPVICTI